MKTYKVNLYFRGREKTIILNGMDETTKNRLFETFFYGEMCTITGLRGSSEFTQQFNTADLVFIDAEEIHV